MSERSQGPRPLPPVEVPIIGQQYPPCQICLKPMQNGEHFMQIPVGSRMAAMHTDCFWETLRWANRKMTKSQPIGGKKKGKKSAG